MELIESKSLLAKLMATENLVIEQRPVQTASFDIKNRILTVPVLDKNISGVVYDLFMGHEVGHALYTPMEGMLKVREMKLNRDVANVVEDSRIERKIKNKFPGLRNSFVKAYNELMDKDFFGVKDSDINKLNFIDRINLHCKGGAGLRIAFTDFELELLNEVETTESYDDVIEVSKKIIDYMKKQIEEEEQKKVQSGDGDDESDEFEEIEFDEDGEYAPQDSSGASGDTGEDEEDDSPSVEDGDEKTKATSSQKAEDKIKSHTSEAFRENEKQLFDSNPGVYSYANIPEIDTKNIFDHKQLWKKYKNENFKTSPDTYIKIRNESNKVVSYLVKEFEMRKNADQLKRASTAKTGELDMKKVFSYQFSEDIFKKITVVPGGKSHGLVMFLDWSGSMVEHIGNTTKQLINLVLFCKKVNIPYEVYSFIETPEAAQAVRAKTFKPDDLSMRGFGLYNLLSSRMSSAEFTYAASALVYMSGLSPECNRAGYTPYWMQLSGTPLNETIIASMVIVPEFQKKYKLQVVNTIFLTDGEGHDLRETNTSSGYSRYINEKTETLVIRDPITKQQEFIKYGSSVKFRGQQTKSLIRLLRARTDSNVIGFYVTSGREFGKKIYEWFPKQSNHEELKADFRKNKYLVLENSGYNEYYVLKSDSLDTEEDAVFEVKDNITNKGLVSAFTKYNGNRISSRIVLNRFIGMVV